MEYRFVPLAEAHAAGCLAILNRYIVGGPAAFFQDPLPETAAGRLIGMFAGFPNAAVLDANGRVAGFGGLRTFMPIPTFARSAETTIFIAPEHTGKGLGARLLAYFEAGARELGIEVILAAVAAENEGSIRFHERHGFVRCGLFEGVYEKDGRVRDLAYLRKYIGRETAR